MRSVLSTFFTFALATIISISITIGSAVPAFAQPTTATLPGLAGKFTGTRPDNIGVTEGHLAGCPTTPNCVVSQGADADHAIPPIFYEGDRTIARANILNILSVVPRTEVVEQTDDYILAQSESRLMGFVDDTEFYFPADEKVVQVRAAARMGESDLGVNRRRIEQIRLAFNDLTKRTAAQ
ncbi:MAG: DUF1499 domain-containing protein [Cyanobacteria bacterium J06627_28]